MRPAGLEIHENVAVRTKCDPPPNHHAEYRSENKILPPESKVAYFVNPFRP